MNTRSAEFEALTVLRAIFDLADADVRPTADLLGRLLGHSVPRVDALLTHLRGRGLVQRDRLGLSMGGLAIATGLPPVEPQWSTPAAEGRERAA